MHTRSAHSTSTPLLVFSQYMCALSSGRVGMDSRVLRTVRAFCYLSLHHVDTRGDNLLFCFPNCYYIAHRLFRACALLGSLECVHGSVDKGLSLLEQAAAKVYDIVHLNFDQFDSNDAIGCLRCSSGTWAALLCQASKGTRWRRFK